MKRSAGKIRIGIISLAAILTIPLVFLPTATLAIEFTFTPIDVPGGYLTTSAYGINNSGNIVGTYIDVKGGHGFLYEGGNFTPIDVSLPGAWRTGAFGINDSGDIVGYYTDTTGNHGFLYSGGNFSKLDLPGDNAPYIFIPQGINNSGNIVGNSGVLYAGGSFTPINLPGAGYTYAQGINNSGNIVGCSPNGGFLYAEGSFTPINFPGATYWSPGTCATGINDSGDIVGYYIDATGTFRGFLDVGGNFSTVDFPGASTTRPTGINDSGTIVGYYLDSNGWYHGFIATPALKPVSIDIEPDHINPKSKGKIEVAILSTKEFDAPGMVDIESLTFGRTGAEESLAFCHGAEDVNRDGLQDLVCHFYTQDTGFQCSDTQGILKGKTVKDIPIEGRDSVNIVPCK